MSVMKKKLGAERSPSASYDGLIHYMQSLHLQISSSFAKTIGQGIVTTQIDLALKSFTDIEADMKDLHFALGYEGQDCQIIIEISGAVARAIGQAKLGGQPYPKPPLALFDLLMTKPLAEKLLAGLQDLGGITPGGGIAGRSFEGMDGFGGVKFAGQDHWLKLSFPMAASGKSPDKQKPKKTDTGFVITLYMAASIADMLMCTAQDNKARPVINPDDPWPRHMRTIMLGSTRSLEIVIEDLRLSVAECTRLELGQVIALPGVSHERLNIKTRCGAGSLVLAGATLGVFKSGKAVRLNEDIDPAFFGELETIDHKNNDDTVNAN